MHDSSRRTTRAGCRGLAAPLAFGLALAGPLSLQADPPAGPRMERLRVGPERPISFENQIVPILSKLGCAGGACHGKAEGQNGFKLSVFGHDPGADHDALVKDARGRRVMTAAPELSLILRKPLALLPHGGGMRLVEGSREHRTLMQWIATGAPFGSPADPRVERIEVLPGSRVLRPGAAQQLQVAAFFSDGSREDVTGIATYSSNAPPIVTVDERGLARTQDLAGEAAVMASYLGNVAVLHVVIPHELEDPFVRPPERNFIDGLVWDKLEMLGIQPSRPASDEEYLRRVYLDLIGTLPSPEEVRRFLADAPEPPASFPGVPVEAGKRARLVDELLERPEFVDYWALKWADILRVDRQTLKAKGAYAFYEWLRASIRENKPYDRFVRELLTAQGSSECVGPANLYRVLTTPEQLASTTSQLFLGVRIECAQCHHHPFDKWSQEDFYGMVGFFSRVESRTAGEGADICVGRRLDVKNPRTGAVVPPHALEETPEATRLDPDADPRTALAYWMTSPANRWFARVIANRLWAHFLGRGLVEPTDDLRQTNPAQNEPLLAALARFTVDSGFDLRKVIRAITGSQVYQLASSSSPETARDDRNFSHALLRPLPAEVLLDAVSQVTGRPEDFPLLPAGTRAIQLWDNRMQHYFLEAFGRPLRVTACECERMSEPSIAQVLHLMNSPEIQAKVSHRHGRVKKLIEARRSPREIVEDLYLAAYTRRPHEGELAAAMGYLAERGEEQARAAEDLLWTLMNTTEFLFNH